MSGLLTALKQLLQRSSRKRFLSNLIFNLSNLGASAGIAFPIIFSWAILHSGSTIKSQIQVNRVG
ncbi:MAG: hypothetical protein OFPII_13200 [Osedax symbiont Rs1]|nr:MAG: hypothetical protein OFPII_13200 [Osedax symbiont Rs1]